MKIPVTNKHFSLHQQFWLHYPLFWIGLHLLLGSGCAAGWGFGILPLAFVLWLPAFLNRSWLRLLGGILLFVCSWLHASFSFLSPQCPDKGLNGLWYFSIAQVKTMQTPFGPTLNYQGHLSGYLTEKKEHIYNLPCQIQVKESVKRPLANSDYLIRGRLCKTRKGQYILKPAAKQVWQAVSGTHSFAEWRLQGKHKVGRYLKTHFGTTSCASLFTSLATGDIDERSLAIEFNRLGLSHILAISGFHFSLFSFFILVFLRLFFPFKITHWTALFLMSAYLFFLGPAPSAIRACCAISLALLGKISCLRSNGMNALGAGLTLLLLWNPIFCQNLGFQLSFLCTAALLLLYEPCENLLAHYFIKRSAQDVKLMSITQQHGALFATILRKALALTLAVHIVTLPVCLFYFGTFPLLGSLLYNLFFPFLLSISVLLLLSGSIVGFILPSLGQIIHSVNSSFTHALLTSVHHAPSFSKGLISFGSISPIFIALWLAGVLTFVMHNQKT